MRLLPWQHLALPFNCLAKYYFSSIATISCDEMRWSYKRGSTVNAKYYSCDALYRNHRIVTAAFEVIINVTKSVGVWWIDAVIRYTVRTSEFYSCFSSWEAFRGKYMQTCYTCILASLSKLEWTPLGWPCRWCVYFERRGKCCVNVHVV